MGGLIDGGTFCNIYSHPFSFGETSVVRPAAPCLNVRLWVCLGRTDERFPTFSTPAGRSLQPPTHVLRFLRGVLELEIMDGINMLRYSFFVRLLKFHVNKRASLIGDHTEHAANPPC